MPCSRRNSTDHRPIGLRRAARHRADGKTDDGDQEQRLAPKARRQPANRRGHDRRRRDVGRQDPGDLVIARRETALHIGQRHIGDGLVERLQHRGANGARRDHGPMMDSLLRHDGECVGRCLCREDAVRLPLASNLGPSDARGDAGDGGMNEPRHCPRPQVAELVRNRRQPGIPFLVDRLILDQSMEAHHHHDQEQRFQK